MRARKSQQQRISIGSGIWACTDLRPRNKGGKVTPDRDGCQIVPLVVLSHNGQYNFLYPSEIIKILKDEKQDKLF